MFVKNETHLQLDIFGMESQLSKNKREKLNNSRESFFYHEIFCNINEDDFSELFSLESSRPNAPVNVLVASCILKEHNGWTIEELLDRIDFDLLTRTALGLNNISETPFCPATFFNFQNRLLKHFTNTGENLLEHVFNNMTTSQLEKLKIKTSIQRMDSFQALSNIRSYSRIQLLIEMILRLHRILKHKEQKRFHQLLSPYLSQSSSKYVYGLKGADITHELQKLGEVYHILYTAYKDVYSNNKVFKVFERVYTEHFTIADKKIIIREGKELSSSSLQAPDDLDATFRKKNGKSHKGQVINISETANLENELNLITDVAIASNNTDDSTILNERIDEIKSKTPDLDELHTDGAYGSNANDKKMETEEINHIQTAVRGRDPQVEIKIEEISTEEFRVNCPSQEVISEKTKKRFKATFDITICSQCKLCDKCPTVLNKSSRVFYFNRDMILLQQRANAIKQLPLERRKIRPNVEATVKQFSKAFNHKGKLRIRGRFKTELFAFTMSIAINFGRIYRFVIQNSGKTLTSAKINMIYNISNANKLVIYTVLRFLELLTPKSQKSQKIDRFVKIAF